MKNNILFLSLLLFLACQHKKITVPEKQVHFFTHATWAPNDRISFKFIFQDTNIYELQGNIYVKKYIPFSNLPLNLVIQTPGGSTVYREITISLRQDGMLKGENESRDMQKIKITLMPYFKPNKKGETYQLFLYHSLPVEITGYIDRLEVWWEEVKEPTTHGENGQ